MNQNIRSFQQITPRIAADAFVDASAVIIGDCNIKEGASIWPNSVLRGDLNLIEVGAFSNLQDNSTVHNSHQSDYFTATKTIIGDYVTVGHNCILHGCTIEDEALIGMGSIILDKAVISRHVLIGAGSLIPAGKVLESGFLYLGSPAKKIRALNSAEIEFFKYSALHYNKISQKHHG